MPMFMDFESSGLYDGSYPIEVGMAWEDDGVARSEGFLISPHRTWTTWSSQSEAVHGIPRALLATGVPAADAARRILSMLSRARKDGVYSDAPSWEQGWLDMLLSAGGTNTNERKAAVGSIQDATEAWGMACRPLLDLLPPPGTARRHIAENWIRATAVKLIDKAVTEEQSRVRVRHRAIPDAEGMLWIYRETRRRAEAAALAWAHKPLDAQTSEDS